MKIANRLGYACLNLTLQEERKLTTNRGMIQKTFLAKGLDYVSQLALANVRDLLEIVRWNVENDVRIFRISSDVFPWMTEYRFEQLPDFTEIRALLEEIGRQPIRLTTHPGPFNKLAGTGLTLDRTVIDLEQHSAIFDWMGLVPSHENKINIHVGGGYGDKDETLRRFAANFRDRLSENLKKRLTVENDDKPGLFSTRELVPLHELVGIPLVFDYLHHSLHPGGWTEEEAFRASHATWSDAIPVFHYSDSRRIWEDATARAESHSDWIHAVPNTYGKVVDLMFETKMKERALLRLMEQAREADVEAGMPLAAMPA